MTGWYYGKRAADFDFTHLASLRLSAYVLDPQDASGDFHKNEDIQKLVDTGADVYALVELDIVWERRPYFQQKWKHGQAIPPWLDREELKMWGDGLPVAFWDRNWHTVIGHHVDALLAQPYTGLFLDGAGATAECSERTNPEGDMLRFIEAVHERATRTLFDAKLIVGGPTQIVDHPNFTRVVDGIAYEDHYFFENAPDLMPHDMTELIKFKRHHGDVYIAEYNLTKENENHVKHECARQGFVLFCGDSDNR